MSKTYDGGPAFPLPASRVNNPNPGMTLRQWYAGQAMKAILANSHIDPKATSPSEGMIADWSFRMADAMLHAGEGPE